MKRLSLSRKPDGSIISGKAAKAANSGKALKAKSEKKARKKLRKLSKPVTDKKRAKLIEKAARIEDPQIRFDTFAVINKRATKQPKEKADDFIGKRVLPKLPADLRAVYEEQLFDADPRKRDEAWMGLTGIPEEATK